ncbi:MAG: cupin domain-containing protein [Saprospiraceae bacterium]
MAVKKSSQSNSNVYFLATTSVLKPFVVPGIATAYIVKKDNFPVITDATCYVLEMWKESMRITHWHPNSSELGYVIAGEIQIILWRSPGETAVFTIGGV